MPKLAKVPWTGQYATRAAVSGVSLAGKDEIWTNCYLTKLNGQDVAVKRQGWQLHTTPAAGAQGVDILIWLGNSNKVISAFGTTNSTIYDGTTSLGAITGYVTSLTETQTGSTLAATLAISSSDNTGWWTTALAVSTGLTFTGTPSNGVATVTSVSSTTGLLVGQAISGTNIPAATRILSIDSATQITMSANATGSPGAITITREVLAKITDTDFPGNAGYTLAGGFCHNDGYAFIGTTDGKIWASDLNTMSAWTANSYDTASDSPDALVACWRHEDNVLAFGKKTLEIWYNAGLSPFPLAKTGTPTIKIGLSWYGGVTGLSNYTFFIGNEDNGEVGIYQYTSVLSRISTPEIDGYLSSLTSIGTTLVMSAMRKQGRHFLILYFSSSFSLVYCVEDKRWHIWSAAIAYWYKCVGYVLGSDCITYSLSNSATSGKVFKTTDSGLVWQDDGNAITSTIQSAADDSGTPARKFYREFLLDADKESAASSVTVAYSDDDFANFVTAGTIDLNANQKLVRIGASDPVYNNRRAWKLTHAANTGFRIRKAAYTFDAGTTT